MKRSLAGVRRLSTSTLDGAKWRSLLCGVGITICSLVLPLAGCGGSGSNAATVPPPTDTPTPTLTASPTATASPTSTPSPLPPPTVNVVTYQYNTARTGQNVHATILTPDVVAGTRFGQLFSQRLDGYPYAQPLYVVQVRIPGLGVHNVVYVATEHDSLYAFDADSADPPNDQPLWQVNFAAAVGGTTIPSTDVHCTDLVPEIGITGTPVIDAASRTLYVVARTKEAGDYVQRLHAIDIRTGGEKFGGPVVIGAVVSGSGDGAVDGSVAFDPLLNNQRAGLLLANGTVYLAWASQCDQGAYHGWVMAYDATTLQQRFAFVTTPNGSRGGVWQSGAAPSSDAGGMVYLVTGNGSFDANLGGTDYGDTVLKLSGTGQVADYFTPYNQAELEEGDLDLGSTGVVLLPDQPGAHPHLAVVSGKQGTLYLIDRDNMGQFNPLGDTQIVQSIPRAVSGRLFGLGPFGGPAYWNGNLYFIGAANVPMAFQLAGGMLSTAPVSQASTTFGYPGAVPVISANGSSTGILWAVEPRGPNPAILHAYDANDLSHELYNSSTGSSPDFGEAVKFVPPVVVNGKVYVATNAQLTVFGLADPGA